MSPKNLSAVVILDHKDHKAAIHGRTPQQHPALMRAFV